MNSLIQYSIIPAWSTVLSSCLFAEKLMLFSFATPGGGDGQGGLVCSNSWGRKESDTTERLN